MLKILRAYFRSRIKRLLPPSKPDKEAALPLGLSRDQLSQIQGLTEMIPYKHYLVGVERLYENNLAAILRGLPHEAHMVQCGVCLALEPIAALPGDLTLKLRELDARHSASAQPESDADADAIFANTPFWDAYLRLGKPSTQYRSSGVSLPRERSDPSMGPRENGG